MKKKPNKYLKIKTINLSNTPVKQIIQAKIYKEMYEIDFNYGKPVLKHDSG